MLIIVLLNHYLHFSVSFAGSLSTMYSLDVDQAWAWGSLISSCVVSEWLSQSHGIKHQSLLLTFALQLRHDLSQEIQTYIANGQLDISTSCSRLNQKLNISKIDLLLFSLMCFSAPTLLHFTKRIPNHSVVEAKTLGTGLHSFCLHASHLIHQKFLLTLGPKLHPVPPLFFTCTTTLVSYWSQYFKSFLCLFPQMIYSQLPTMNF